MKLPPMLLSGLYISGYSIIEDDDNPVAYHLHDKRLNKTPLLGVALSMNLLQVKFGDLLPESRARKL